MTDAAVRARDETKLCSYFSSFESVLDQVNHRFDGASISLPLLKIPIPMVVRCSMFIDKPECVTMVDDVSDAQQTPSLSGGWANRVKILLFVASVFLTLSPTSHAAPPGGGFHGGSFRSGFGAHSAGPAFRMGSGIRRNFAFHQNRRFFHRDPRVFSQHVALPFYS